MKLWRLFRSLFTRVPRARPAECAARVRSGEALLVDVREPGEWKGGVADQAVLLSLSDLYGARTHWQSFLARSRGRELILYCKAGGRSALAAKLLAAEGFNAADGGSLAAWKRSGWPIVSADQRVDPKT